MNNEKDKLIKSINEMLEKPGGKQAARFALNSMGAIPFVGGVFAAAGDLWGEKEQQELNQKIAEWASQVNIDLQSMNKTLENIFKEPSKTTFALLLGESLNVQLPTAYPVEGGLSISTILHNDTYSEFEAYEQKGWISIISNGNMSSMGGNNKIGNSIEDKKRPRGMGTGYVITLNETLFDE